MSTHETVVAVREAPPYIEITEEVLIGMVDAIVAAVNPERIVLFGSHALDAANRSSDVDLLVIQRDPFSGTASRTAVLANIRKALKRFFVPKDVLLYSMNDLEKLRAFPGHIIHECLRDGRVLYERTASSSTSS